VLPECSVTAWVSEVKKLRFVFYKKPENNLISTLFPYKKILSSFPSVFCWRVDDSKRQTVAVTIGQSGLESDYLALKPSSTFDCVSLGKLLNFSGPHFPHRSRNTT